MVPFCLCPHGYLGPMGLPCGRNFYSQLPLPLPRPSKELESLLRPLLPEAGLWAEDFIACKRKVLDKILHCGNFRILTPVSKPALV